ncbi:hypothetical protein BD408DRAFT_429456, partial [Parasitella parasitica]
MPYNTPAKKGRPTGSKSKHGSKTPGPKPAHLVNQPRLSFPVAVQATRNILGSETLSAVDAVAVNLKQTLSNEKDAAENIDEIVEEETIHNKKYQVIKDFEGLSVDTEHNAISKNSENEADKSVVDNQAELINEGDRFENNEEAIVDELTEEQFHSIENQISEIPENGWLD